MSQPQIIGWREWVECPDWNLRMRAKVDTGARSSAIDCGEITELPGDRVRFTVRLDRKQKKLVTLEEPIKLRKHVSTEGASLANRTDQMKLSGKRTRCPAPSEKSGLRTTYFQDRHRRGKHPTGCESLRDMTEAHAFFACAFIIMQ